MRTHLPVRVTGTGSYAPERILTNLDLARMMDTSDEWITARTGIKERRIAPDDMVTSDMAAEAGRRALADAGRSPEELDLIICATSTPDRVIPPTATYVQAKMGAWNAGAVDHIAACAGFIYSLSSAWHYVAGGQVRNCLVIGVEMLTRFTNWQDRGTCILFGDAAGAFFVETAPDGGSDILYAKLGADGRGGDLIVAPVGGTALMPTPERVAAGQHLIQMKGREVYRFAVNKFTELIADAARACAIQPAEFDAVVPHQVNLRIIESAIEKLGLDPAKVVVNIERYGNTSAASVPVAFDEAVRAGRIRRGDLVVSVAFGAGLTWGSLALRY